ncbi:ABC transporter ATP-binding protein [Rhodohalobacter sulfatireducens]|uniref:ABC transporter ATP-binding protein n=1 Tax=Rhodohalobacter sulfatireducens TaxID=2911366 RepID=A0ABS9KAU4_9BACT|nr:ABC transporter ATP-binding protein [Rhodohalobacter sulfatireducens]MCG2587972.1 ABC transporter ATP-binding protein [Rhodohalobacter sulfatireducens]
MLLEGKNIDFKYGNEIIFKDFSFELNEGEKLVLKGESGSGKSTLFRLILGFEHPNNGEFLYNGSILKNDTLKSFRKETAWLPQDLNIGNGSVKEVIEYPFQFKSSSVEKPDPATIKNLLIDLRLESSILEKSFSDLSTGQRQRIGILICILMNKPLMLLDEPTSALDRESKVKLADLLLNSDRTILSTSHDPFWVERCDRIIEIQPN